MALNKLFSQIGSLVQNDAEIEEAVPCKTDILGLRECRKGGKTKDCDGISLDLMHCMAHYKIDVTAKLRTSIGVAQYNEYLKDLEEKHGKEKATEIIDEPKAQLKQVEAYQMLYRLGNDSHPKGAPKTEADLASWTQADQARLEMGEMAWWDSVKVVAAEFGEAKADRLFGINKESATVAQAIDRILPGSQKAQADALSKLNTLMGPVREAAPDAKSVEDIAAAFKQVYPTKADLDAAL